MSRSPLEAGATILAAPAGGYDAAEPNEPFERYQDFGHNHWHNSLIWGEDLRDIAIVGPGLICGRGLSRGVAAEPGLLPANTPGAADKAIALERCRSKTGVPVRLKVGAPLKAVLDATPRVSPLILVTTTNKPWTGGGLRASWRIAQAAAGVVGVTFNDLRGTAATRLALVGCTEAEIAAITGHSLRTAINPRRSLPAPRPSPADRPHDPPPP